MRYLRVYDKATIVKDVVFGGSFNGEEDEGNCLLIFTPKSPKIPKIVRRSYSQKIFWTEDPEYEDVNM